MQNVFLQNEKNVEDEKDEKYMKLWFSVVSQEMYFIEIVEFVFWIGIGIDKKKENPSRKGREWITPGGSGVNISGCNDGRWIAVIYFVPVIFRNDLIDFIHFCGDYIH